MTAAPASQSLSRSAPARVQLSRAKGFNLQEASRAFNGLPCVKVDRTTKWGNPFKAGGSLVHLADAFRSWMEVQRDPRAWDMARAAERELRGKNLACWCRPGEKCHADVLLEIANRPEPAPTRESEDA